MIEALYWLCQPGFMVILAGFQNIEPSPPEPEAAPAKDRPCAWALCSRTAKPPAIASEVNTNSAAEAVAIARERCSSSICCSPQTRCGSCSQSSGGTEPTLSDMRARINRSSSSSFADLSENRHGTFSARLLPELQSCTAPGDLVCP